MKHPNYPKATNQYLGTTNSNPLNQSGKQSLNENLKAFGIHLQAIIARKEKEKLQRKSC